MLDLLDLSQCGGELLSGGLDLLQEALQLSDVPELAGPELGQARLGGVSDLMDPQIDGEALQVMEMEVEGLCVLLGQGLAEGGQIQFLRQAFDKVKSSLPMSRSTAASTSTSLFRKTSRQLCISSIIRSFLSFDMVFQRAIRP